jgi:hypothetical protein
MHHTPSQADDRTSIGTARHPGDKIVPGMATKAGVGAIETGCATSEETYSRLRRNDTGRSGDAPRKLNVIPAQVGTHDTMLLEQDPFKAHHIARRATYRQKRPAPG